MFVSPALRISPIAVFRSVVMTCGMFPQRTWDRSSSKVTSRTRCDWFSMLQCPRTRPSKRAASARSGSRLVTPATPSSRTSPVFLQIKMDNGSESSGVRTQFLHRMVQLADRIGQPIQLLYYPPSHSKYNPIERCWVILELRWNGTKLVDVETMLAWAKGMTWKGLHPVVALRHKVYQKGISLGKKAMRAVEARLERHPELPKWDMLIRPASTAQ